MDRRKFIGTGAFGAALYIAEKIGALEGSAQFLERVGKAAASKIRSAESANELAKRLLIPGGSYLVVLAKEGVPADWMSYPAEVRAYQSIGSLYGPPHQIAEDDYFQTPEVRTSLLSIGGSGTNLFTRRVLGHETSPSFECTLPGIHCDYKVELPINMWRDTDAGAVSRIQYGEVYRAPRRALVFKSGKSRLYPEVQTHGGESWLKEDFLIALKLKLEPDGVDIVLFPALHAPAIWGIDNLLFDAERADMEAIAKVARQSQGSFQAAFRVTGFVEGVDHNGKKITTPTEISLIPNCTYPLEVKVIPKKRRVDAEFV